MQTKKKKKAASTQVLNKGFLTVVDFLNNLKMFAKIVLLS